MPSIAPPPMVSQHPLEILPYSFDFTDKIDDEDVEIVNWLVETDASLVLSNAALAGDDRTVSVEVAGGLSSYVYVIAAQVTGDNGCTYRMERSIRFYGSAVTGGRISASLSVYSAGDYFLPGYVTGESTLTNSTVSTSSSDYSTDDYIAPGYAA